MATLTVSTQAQLNTALNKASSGDTIRLQSGSYDLKMKGQSFKNDVTITSADKNRPAEIKQMLLTNVENVKLTDLVMDYQRAGKVMGNPLDSGKKFYVDKSSGVTIDNVTFDGEVRNGFGTGMGLRVKDSDDIAILNSEFTNFENGVNFMNVDDVRIAGNTTRRISNDAMTFGAVEGMVMENNRFIDFHSDPKRLHKDAIQFRLTKTEPASSDIIIRNNVIDNPENAHGIWFGNLLYENGNRGAYYRDITIVDNKINTAHLMGVAVQHADGLTIRDNVVTHNKGDGLTNKVNIPLISVSLESKNVTIIGNDVASVQKAQNSTWTVRGNDTDNVTLQHWTGKTPGGRAAPLSVTSEAFEANARVASVADVDADAAASAASAPTEFRLKATNQALNTETGLVVATLDFDNGDEFVFAGFDERTFRDVHGGNPVADFDNGSAVRIDSALDFVEIVDNSPAVAAQVDEAADTLTLLIDQGDDVAKVTFEGLGKAYLAAEAELF